MHIFSDIMNSPLASLKWKNIFKGNSCTVLALLYWNCPLTFKVIIFCFLPSIFFQLSNRNKIVAHTYFFINVNMGIHRDKKQK